MLLSSAMIAVGASGTSPLEMASWIASLATLAIAIVTGVLYLLGRIRPLKCAAEYDKGRHEEKGPVVVVSVTARSRTGNDQTIRGMEIVQVPSAWRRLLRPRSFLAGRPVTRFEHSTIDENPAGVAICGYDTQDLKGYLFREDLPYGKDARLMLATARKRPVLAKIKPVR